MLAKPLHRRHLGENFSEGARRLWAVVDNREITQAGLTAALGARPGVVSRWLYGDRRPSIEWAAKIERLFRIPARLWAEPATEAFEPPGLHRQDPTGTES